MGIDFLTRPDEPIFPLRGGMGNTSPFTSFAANFNWFQNFLLIYFITIYSTHFHHKNSTQKNPGLQPPMADSSQVSPAARRRIKGPPRGVKSEGPMGSRSALSRSAGFSVLPFRKKDFPHGAFPIARQVGQGLRGHGQ